MNNVKAFTLTEVMVTVIIIGMMAAFAIPQYGDMVEKADLRNAIMQAKAVHGANVIYKEKNGDYLVGGPFTAVAIETGLGIDVMEDGLGFFYTGGNASGTITWSMEVNRNPSNTFEIEIDQDAISVSNPCCKVGNCTSLLPACGL